MCSVLRVLCFLMAAHSLVPGHSTEIAPSKVNNEFPVFYSNQCISPSLTSSQMLIFTIPTNILETVSLCLPVMASPGMIPDALRLLVLSWPLQIKTVAAKVTPHPAFSIHPVPGAVLNILQIWWISGATYLGFFSLCFLLPFPSLRWWGSGEQGSQWRESINQGGEAMVPARTSCFPKAFRGAWSECFTRRRKGYL